MKQDETTQALDYSAEELRAVRDAARAGGLEPLASECDAALELRLQLARVPALQRVVEAWRKAPQTEKI